MCVFETEEFNLFISALHNQWAAADMVNKWIFYWYFFLIFKVKIKKKHPK